MYVVVVVGVTNAVPLENVYDAAPVGLMVKVLPIHTEPLLGLNNKVGLTVIVITAIL